MMHFRYKLWQWNIFYFIFQDRSFDFQWIIIAHGLLFNMLHLWYIYNALMRHTWYIHDAFIPRLKKNSSKLFSLILTNMCKIIGGSRPQNYFGHNHNMAPVRAIFRVVYLNDFNICIIRFENDYDFFSSKVPQMVVSPIGSPIIKLINRN